MKCFITLFMVFFCMKVSAQRPSMFCRSFVAGDSILLEIFSTNFNKSLQLTDNKKMSRLISFPLSIYGLVVQGDTVRKQISKKQFLKDGMGIISNSIGESDTSKRLLQRLTPVYDDDCKYREIVMWLHDLRNDRISSYFMGLRKIKKKYKITDIQINHKKFK
jgi:hypothetical protein